MLPLTVCKGVREKREKWKWMKLKTCPSTLKQLSSKFRNQYDWHHNQQQQTTRARAGWQQERKLRHGLNPFLVCFFSVHVWGSYRFIWHYNSDQNWQMHNVPNPETNLYFCSDFCNVLRCWCLLLVEPISDFQFNPMVRGIQTWCKKIGAKLVCVTQAD